LGESADLIYHLLVLLRARGLSLGELEKLLRQRHAKAPKPVG
jgi:phosphoribosyl-ATP pyrophosphohydrolase/phosphoribosyl-AMP cyclohydrolase